MDGSDDQINRFSGISLGRPSCFAESEWVERAQLMLEQAGDHIDYMAFHRYAHPTMDDPFETYMAFATSYDEHLTAYEGLIRAVSLERGIKHQHRDCGGRMGDNTDPRG